MKISDRQQLALKSLIGTSIGDAFGDSFFGDTKEALDYIENRLVPPTKWEFTDDTVMSIAIYKQLILNSKIDQDKLALEFSRLHDIDPNRGYGAGARSVLRDISNGEHWRIISSESFEGMGSMGNGASMRVSCIGAYHFDDLDKVIKLAKQSAEITHMNLEGISGAIAVAIAAAISVQYSKKSIQLEPNEFLSLISKYVPESDTRSKILKGISIPYSYNIETVRAALGDGTKILAQDTVPFSLWCAAHNLANYEEALWKAVSILGDRDTICAIVGGIVILSAPEETIPPKWSESIEKLNSSPFWN